MKNILFHLNKEEDGKKALNNILNLIDDLNGDYEEIELVVHSEGVKSFLKESDLKDNINKVLEKKVKISACQNTLDNLNLSNENLISGIDIVSSGVGEIVKKEDEGYLYIKV